MPKVSDERYRAIIEEAKELGSVEGKRRIAEAADAEALAHARADAPLRVERAVAYAEWRIAAYERGECASPW